MSDTYSNFALRRPKISGALSLDARALVAIDGSANILRATAALRSRTPAALTKLWAMLGAGIALAYFDGFDTAPVVVEDDRRDYGETRLRAFGRVHGEARCLVFTPRDGALHAISFRRAHEKEMRRYGL